MSSILVVDDELSMREFLTILLEKDGHSVQLASDAQSALQIVAEKDLDLIISDIRMPGMSGLDLLTVAKLLGHAEIKTTQIYSHLAQDHLRRQTDQITFGLHVIRGTNMAQTGDPQPQPIVLQGVAL